MVRNRPRLIPSKAYLEWEKRARSILSRVIMSYPYLPTDKEVVVCVKSYYRGQRPDLSNVLGSVGDCIEGYLIKNDRQIVSWDGSRLYHDKDNPRTVIEINQATF